MDLYIKQRISIFCNQRVKFNKQMTFNLLNTVHPDVLFDRRNKNYSVKHIIFIVKIHLYTRLHVSAPHSHHQACTVEQIQI